MITVGVALPYIENIFCSSYYSKILSGVSNRLLNTDVHFRVVLLRDGICYDTYDFKEKEGIDAIVLTQWSRFFCDKNIFNLIKIPCAAINDFEEVVDIHFVCEDSELGAKLAAEHIYDYGHRNVGAVIGSEWSAIKLGQPVAIEYSPLIHIAEHGWLRDSP